MARLLSISRGIPSLSGLCRIHVGYALQPDLQRLHARQLRQVSGFQLYSGSFANDGSAGITPQFTGDTRCGTSLSGTFGDPDCIIVTGAGSSLTEVKPSETFGLIGAGTYTLAFLETSQSRSGSAQFEISAIPLPAGAWLLLSGIGGIALLHRRRKAA